MYRLLLCLAVCLCLCPAALATTSAFPVEETKNNVCGEVTGPFGNSIAYNGGCQTGKSQAPAITQAPPFIPSPEVSNGDFNPLSIGLCVVGGAAGLGLGALAQAKRIGKGKHFSN